jgi:hypothetical protein
VSVSGNSSAQVAINVAAHRYDGRNLAQAFEYLGLDDISGMNNQFRPT